MVTSVLLAYLLVAAPVAQSPDTIVRQAGSPRSRGVSPAVETLSVGTLEGHADYTFTHIEDIAVGKDGSILILEAGLTVGNPGVRLYDAQGRFVRTVGRNGHGPGEYLRPTAVACMPDGRFLVLDALNRRLLVYSRAGEPLETWTIPHYRVSGGGLRVNPVGVIAIRVKLSSGLDGDLAIVRMRPGGGIIDTLPEPDLPASKGVALTSTRGRMNVHSRLTLPYSPRGQWQWSPSGFFVTGVTHHYAIDLRLPRPHADDGARPPFWRQGNSIVSIRVAAPAVSISRSEHADQTALIRKRLREMEGERSGSMPDVPRQKPFYSHFFIGEEGRIWVAVHTASERYTPPEVRTRAGTLLELITWREPQIFDVFEANGAYVGRVRLPYDLHPNVFRGDEIWGYTRDEFYVPYVKRYRVRWN